MISALLLPLLIAAPATPAVAPHDDPPIRLWINNDGRFLPGDRAKVQVRTSYDGYLIVLHVDPEGRLRVLFPLDPDRDNFVRGGKKYEIRGRGGRESFQVDNSTGKGTVYAAVSRDPYRFDGFVIGDHWDYKALAASRLPDDPEPELNELVRRMAQGDFDYDLLNYYVSDRATYASDYDYAYSHPAYYGSVYHDPWCYRFSCGRAYHRSSYGLNIGLFFGNPYRRYYYDPYFYDPFYSPFWYDPYYYAPIYRSYYGHPYPRYYGYDAYYYDRYRSYRQPYTPYRFRGADGIAVGFRDRHGPTRWVNTVYNPPISPVRETPTVTPGRRVRSSPLTDAPGAESRRAADAQRFEKDRPAESRRVKPGSKMDWPQDVSPKRSVSGGAEERRPVEARRAREIETPRAEAREMPRMEPGRTEGRVIDRPAPESRPAREVERPSAPAPQDRSGRRVESGSGGGGRTDGGARPSEGGGRRRR
jgi:uncharacterized protein DUF4384